MVELLLTVRQLPAGVSGVKLAIEREGDDTGVVLEVTLATSKAHQGGNEKSWATFESIAIGEKIVSNSSGGCTWEHGMSKESWQDFATRLKGTLDALPEQSRSARVGIIQQE
jgi:hypothetical protein